MPLDPPSSPEAPHNIDAAQHVAPQHVAPQHVAPQHIAPQHTDAPSPPSEEAALPGSSPARPGPPPRKLVDSAAPEGSGGAPSLPPPVVSPESWRPPAGAERVPRDEAALLELAHASLATADEEAALSHATQCLASFPESARALQIAAGVLVARNDFVGLGAVYEDLISRLSPSPAAAQLCAAASRLWANQLKDGERGRALLERGLALDGHNSSLHRELADLLEASGEHDRALTHSMAALRASPMSPAVARAAYQRLERAGSEDAKFTVAGLLSFLGHTTNHVVDFLASKRSASLPRPTRSLDENDQTFGLDVTPTDPELTKLLALLEPFARRLHLPKPKQQRQLLDGLREEDVERSTTMLARTFGWTCRLLTLGNPGLYLSETNALPALLPVETTSFVVGKSLGRGLSLVELAFLWGRALAWTRPQTRILYTLSTPLALVQWLRALRVVAGLEEASNAEVKNIAKTLRKELPATTLETLLPSLRALDADLELRVASWKDAADRVGNRVGLLACGDPELGARTLDRFPTSDGGTRRQQLIELWSFALSEDYEQLRQRLGLQPG